MKATLDIEGLGKCLVGTYTLRNLTKHFNCSPEYLVEIGYTGGNPVEFISYLLKFSYENALIQAGGAAALKIKPIEEIDLILDANDILNNTDKLNEIFDAICICIYNKTMKERLEEVKKMQQELDSFVEEQEEKKSLTTTSIGEPLTSTVGEQT